MRIVCAQQSVQAHTHEIIFPNAHILRKKSSITRLQKTFSSQQWHIYNLQTVTSLTTPRLTQENVPVKSYGSRKVSKFSVLSFFLSSSSFFLSFFSAVISRDRKMLSARWRHFWNPHEKLSLLVMFLKSLEWKNFGMRIEPNCWKCLTSPHGENCVACIWNETAQKRNRGGEAARAREYGF